MPEVHKILLSADKVGENCYSPNPRIQELRGTRSNYLETGLKRKCFWGGVYTSHVVNL